MRCLLKVSLPIDAGNSLIANGQLTEVIQTILNEQKPEAAYFMEMDGLRTAIVVVDVADPSKIPAIAEPWFLAGKAKVEIHPAMIAEDLMKARTDIDRIVKTFT